MMRAAVVALTVLLAGAAGARAADMSVTNFISGYRLVPSTAADAGDTTLATGTAYAAFPLAALPAVTEAQAGATNATSDIRALAYALADAIYNAIAAKDSTNQPTQFTAQKGVSTTVSGTNVTVSISHQFNTKTTMGAGTLVAE
jgi:hypothetical protein